MKATGIILPIERDRNSSHAQTVGDVTYPPPVTASAKFRSTSGPVSVMRWSSGMMEQLTRFGDVLLLVLAGLPLGIGHVPSAAFPTLFHIAAAAIGLTVGAAFLISHISGYSLHRLNQRIRPVTDAALAIGLTLGVFTAGLALAARLTISDVHWLLSWGLFSVAGIALARQLEHAAVVQGLRSGVMRRKVVFIGATSRAQHLIEAIASYDEYQPSLVVGVFDERSGDRVPEAVAGVGVAGNVDTLCAYATENAVDLIVICLPWPRAMEMFQLVQRVQWISADVMIPIEAGTFSARTASVTSIAGVPALQIMRQPLQGARSLVKLIEDYTIAMAAIILSAPIMLLCAILVKLDSPGPILFRQARVGFNAKTFAVFKFRTMRVDPRDKGVVGVSRHDPRITRFGGIMRKLSLDELPQLFNVMTGDMSIVGPRPHVPGMLVGQDTYANAVQDYAMRHRIKPGITGWAQINGMRGGIHDVRKATLGVDLDMAYVENWSLGLDIRIMLRTIAVGMFGSKVF